MKRIDVALKNGQGGLTFDVLGNLICDLTLKGDSDVDYQAGGSALKTTDTLRKVVADVSKGIAQQAQLSGADKLEYHAAIARRRAVRPIDAFFEGVQLVVLDAAQWLID